MMGRKQVIVATSVLGMGINIPDIRVIWHVDRPRTLLDYAQESGRAGRDGSKSEAIMVVGWDKGDYREKKEEVELVERLLGSQKECRRAVLGEYLDGGERQECQDGEEQCDQCGDEMEEMEQGLEEEVVEGVEQGLEEEVEEVEQGLKEVEARIDGGIEAGEERVGRERRVMAIQRQQQEISGRRGQERMQQEGLELEELEQYLRQARGKCRSCVRRGIRPDQHSLFWCREESSAEARQEYQALKEAIRQGRTMEVYSGCMECFLPQAWCQQWEQDEREGGMYRRQAGVRCQFPDVVLSEFVVGMAVKANQERIRERMAKRGYDIEKREEMLKYIGQRRRWGGLESNELLREVYWIQREGAG
jgi:superfamily II DNA/RNA helicase